MEGERSEPELANAEAAAVAPPPTGDTVSQTPLAFDSPVSPAASNEDSSYPPVDLDADFFASHHAHGDHSLDLEERDPRMALKLTPGAAQRRRQLAKYVKAAVGVASAVCLAALVKVAVAGHDDSDAPRRRTAVAQASPPAAAPAEPPAQAATYIAPSAVPPAASAVAAASAEPVAAAAAVASAAASEEAPPAAPPAAAEPAASAPAASAEAPAATPAQVQPDAEQAKKEKTLCRVALERGRLTEAVEAGERAVALDPTDGEAWLILGAAYQSKGNAKDARRCYKSCVQEGKRGPRNECAAMLR